MSKCQARKFLAGGRCSGNSGSCVKEDTSSISSSFASLLAQREAMDAKIWTTTKTEIQTTPFTQTTTLAIVKQKVPSKEQQRKADIDFVLEGDS